MADKSIFQGGNDSNVPSRPTPGVDEPPTEPDDTGGFDPLKRPDVVTRDPPEDWEDPDLPAPDEETPLSDDRR